MELSGKVIWAFALGVGIGQAGSATLVTVLVYDYAQVSDAKLAEAEAFAARSFRAAGIELTWVECSVSGDGSEKFRGCEQANHGHRVFLNIIPETMAAGIRPSGDSDEALGVAFASHASVVYPRVCEVARVWGVPEYVILGRTMAHELGHVLLGSNSHSAAGLMQPRFGRRDLSLESGQFLFDPQQAKRLRLAASAKPPISEVRLTVRVYDYVNLPAGERDETMANAKRVLLQAGVSVEFVQCSRGGEQAGGPSCTGLLGPADLVLRIFEPKMAVKGEELGYAAMTPEGGSYITVFMNPAQRRARVGNLSDGCFLGHAVAHEIGHLLLGASSHSSSGVMRSPWRPRDEEWMTKGALQFSSAEATQMRLALAERFAPVR